ncbi:MAG: type VI secretion system tube protein Hcp [Spirochaetaceae bacterium]|jgi:type VI secretion system Hcp family effector|nr:type VI secretion system tube protein Hcp [Spirochaetaceae bacterium]
MASVYFLQLDGIEGQAADKAHDKWLELVSFSHGGTQNVSIQRSGDVAGRGEFFPFKFTHAVDKATPKLQLYCMNGNKIAKAVFSYCRVIGGAQTSVYEVTMENVRVSKAEIKTIDTSTTDNPLTRQPVEDVELVAGKMTWKVTPIKPDGSKDGAIEASYDQIANE